MLICSRSPIQFVINEIFQQDVCVFEAMVALNGISSYNVLNFSSFRYQKMPLSTYRTSENTKIILILKINCGDVGQEEHHSKGKGLEYLEKNIPPKTQT